jgi:hypothetical protein
MVGSEKEGKLFGHYQIYETLKYQYEGGELNEDQLKIMGLKTLKYQYEGGELNEDQLKIMGLNRVVSVIR